MSVSDQQMRLPAAVSRKVRWAVFRRCSPLVGFAAIAGYLEWRRLQLTTPSLIDDWYAITYSPSALRALVHGAYGSSPIDLDGRYRPAYAAIWNYLQWHTLGGPSLTTAAVWGFLRVTFFLAAIWLLARLLTRGGLPNRDTATLFAPIAVALTPAIAVDLVRHSPAEPLMLTGLIMGLAAMGAGIRDALENGPSRKSVGLIVAGYIAYLFGVYSKETSLGILALGPFAVLWLRPILRKRVAESRRARYGLAAVALLLLAPLVQLGLKLGLLLSTDSVVSNPDFGLARKVYAAAILPILGAPGPLGTFLWVVATPAAIAASVVAVRRREPTAWLLVGILSSGFVMSAIALARGDTPSRYFIPWIVAIAAVGARLLTRAPRFTQVGVGLVILAIALSATPRELGQWTDTERSGSTAVEMARGAIGAHCPVYLANFDVERRVAIPRLLRFGRTMPVPECTSDSHESYAISWQDAPLPPWFARRCGSGWRLVERRNSVASYRCQSMASVSLRDQDAASGMPNENVVYVRVGTRPVDPRTLF